MDDPRRLEAKGLARAKIRAKRRRVSSIRSRTIRGSLALFAVVWLVVLAHALEACQPSRTGALLSLYIAGCSSPRLTAR